MSVVILPIIGNDRTISRNVWVCAANAILSEANLPRDRFKIVFEEDVKNVQLTETLDSGAVPVLTADRRDALFITAVERFTENKLLNTPMVAYRKQNLLLDEHIGLSARTVFMNTEVSLSVRVRFSSKSEMDITRRRFAFNEKRRPLAIKFPVAYDYTLPNALGDFVGHVHYLRETQGGYGDELSDYVASIVKTPYGFRSNQSNTFKVMAFGERQTNIIGQVQSEMFYNDREYSEGIYELSFDFMFHYEQPTHIHCELPIIVHNQPISDTFVDAWIMRKSKGESATVDVDTALIFDEPSHIQYLGDGGKRFLNYDDWFPSKVMGNTKTLLIFPILVSPDDPNLAFTLDDLDPDSLDPRVKRFITNYPETTKEYLGGPYYIEIIELNDVESHYGFTLNASGEFRTVVPMEIRRRYYARISYVDDHARLANMVIKEFLKTTESATDALAGVAPHVEVSTSYVAGKLHRTPDDAITEYSYNKFILSLPGTSTALKATQGRYTRTVQSAVPIAKRK